MLKLNLILVGTAGLGLLLTAVALLSVQQQLAGLARFILPIPPLAVAAYVYVANLARATPVVQHTFSSALVELGIATLVAAVVFALFAALLMVAIIVLPKPN